jgi:opacity protein-like surface antigen
LAHSGRQALAGRFVHRIDRYPRQHRTFNSIEIRGIHQMLRKTWEALAGAAIIAGSLLGATTAQAADLGGKAYGRGSVKDAGPAIERPQIGNWGGIYVGMNVGVNWEEYTSDYRRFADLAVNPDSPKYSSSETTGILGGHVGIQHQMGRIVVGLEASWSGKAPFGNDWHGQKCFNQDPPLGGGQIHSREYDPQNIAGLGTENWKWVARHDGWFIGGGAEMMLRDRWVLGLEYLHVNLDGQTHYKPIVSAQTRQIDADADIVRLRLSYKFGRGDGGHTDQPLK